MIPVRLMRALMFSARRAVSQRYEELASMSPRDKPANDTKEVVKQCAMTCLEHWDPVVDAQPCGDAATDASKIVLLVFADPASDRISHDATVLLGERVDRPDPDDQGRRITSARAARLARRAAVAANEDVRSDLSTSSETAAHKKLDSKKTPSKKAPVALSQQASGPPDTPKSKSTSALSKNASAFPTFLPSSCGASGTSCGGETAGPARVLKRKIGVEQKGVASSSSPAFKREAGPHPASEAPSSAAENLLSIPEKLPSSCGPAGGTCGGADGTGPGGVAKREASTEQEGTASSLLLHEVKHKAKTPPAPNPRRKDEHPPGWVPSSCGFPGSSCGGSTGTASMPPSQAAKREAEAQPVAAIGKRPPGFTPSSCTNPGVTCGLSKGSGKGSDTGPPAPYNYWGFVHGTRRPNATDFEV